MRCLKTCLLFLFLAAIPCQAQSADAQKCAKETDPDLVLTYCTRAIESGGLSTSNLAVIFSSRGSAYYGKGDYDRAIQDYDQATRLNPNYSNAFINRGLTYKFKGDFDRSIQNYDQAIRLSPTSVWAFAGRGASYFAKGDYDRAIEDFDAASKLAPRNPEAFKGRGLAQFCLGHFALAQTDFTEALRLDPNEVFSAIWLFLVKTKSTNDLKMNQSELRRNVPHPESGEWPGFVAAFFLSTAPSDRVLSVAKSPYQGDPKLRLCEAYFYVGERSLIDGKNIEAADFFQKALDSGGTGASEYQLAKEELRRLRFSTYP